MHVGYGLCAREIRRERAPEGAARREEVIGGIGLGQHGAHECDERLVAGGRAAHERLARGGLEGERLLHQVVDIGSPQQIHVPEPQDAASPCDMYAATGARLQPVPLHRPQRGAERLGGLLLRVPGEVTALHQPHQPLALRRELRQGIVEHQHLLGVVLHRHAGLFEWFVRRVAAALVATAGACVVDEDLPHRHGRDGEEVPAVLPTCAAFVHGGADTPRARARSVSSDIVRHAGAVARARRGAGRRTRAA